MGSSYLLVPSGPTSCSDDNPDEVIERPDVDGHTVRRVHREGTEFMTLVSRYGTRALTEANAGTA